MRAALTHPAPLCVVCTETAAALWCCGVSWALLLQAARRRPRRQSHVHFRYCEWCCNFRTVQCVLAKVSTDNPTHTPHTEFVKILPPLPPDSEEMQEAIAAVEKEVALATEFGDAAAGDDPEEVLRARVTALRSGATSYGPLTLTLLQKASVSHVTLPPPLSAGLLRT